MFNGDLRLGVGMCRISCGQTRDNDEDGAPPLVTAVQGPWSRTPARKDVIRGEAGKVQVPAWKSAKARLRPRDASGRAEEVRQGSPRTITKNVSYSGQPVADGLTRGSSG